MTQVRITKQRGAASARRRSRLEPLPLDPRDPDIVRAKQLQRQISTRGRPGLALPAQVVRRVRSAGSSPTAKGLVTGMFNAHHARSALGCHQGPICAAQCQLPVSRTTVK